MGNETGNRKASLDAIIHIFVQPVYRTQNDGGHDDIQQISRAVSISTVRVQKELDTTWPDLALVEIGCATLRQCRLWASILLWSKTDYRFSEACHCGLCWDNSNQSIDSHIINLRLVLVISSSVHLPHCLLPSEFPVNIHVYAFLSFL
jgi:hypothetical protein